MLLQVKIGLPTSSDYNAIDAFMEKVDLLQRGIEKGSEVLFQSRYYP